MSAYDPTSKDTAKVRLALATANRQLADRRADLDACRALNVALLKHIEQLEKALKGILWDCDNCFYRCEHCGHQDDIKDMDLCGLARAALAGNEQIAAKIRALAKEQPT